MFPHDWPNHPKSGNAPHTVPNIPVNRKVRTSDSWLGLNRSDFDWTNQFHLVSGSINQLRGEPTPLISLCKSPPTLIPIPILNSPSLGFPSPLLFSFSCLPNSHSYLLDSYLHNSPLQWWPLPPNTLMPPLQAANHNSLLKDGAVPMIICLPPPYANTCRSFYCHPISETPSCSWPMPSPRVSH